MDPWALFDSAGPRKVVENPWSDHNDVRSEVKKTERLIDIDDNPWSTTPTTISSSHPGPAQVEKQRPKSPDPWLQWTQPQPSVSDLNDSFSRTNISQAKDDDNDDFGDFEDAGASYTPAELARSSAPVQGQPHPKMVHRNHNSTTPNTKVAPSNTIHLKPGPQVASSRTVAPLSSWQQAPASSRVPQNIPRATKAADPNVLFDADEEFSSDHEETRASQIKPWSRPATKSKQAPAPDDFDPWSPIEETAPTSNTSISTAADLLSDSNPFPTMAFSSPATQGKALPQQQSRPAQLPTSSTPSTSRQIPRNIPPPHILLTLCTSLISSLPATLSSPSTTSPLLHSTLTTLHVSFRILCGRKSRWRRDTFLSQSMSISAASSKHGMKLAGVDKSLIKIEDATAEQLIEKWKGVAGRVKKGVAEMARQEGKKVIVPDFGGSLFVRTVKPDVSATSGVNGSASVNVKGKTGAGTAKQVCILCGLRRDERCVGIDDEENVYDAFGEWWAEHWGHRACAEFWDMHEEGLRGR